MKTIGIYTGKYMSHIQGDHHWDGESVKNGMGGSETWAFEIACRLTKFDFDVTLYGDPEYDHDPCENFHLVSHEKFFYDTLHREFDYFIFSRYASIDVITPYLRCHNVFVMIHDICILTPEGIPNQIGLSRVKKYGYLSEWHKDYLLDLYNSSGLCKDSLYKVSNGYSEQYYKDIDFSKKTKSMVWSSSLARGFEDFYEYVFMPIIKEVPDFKLYVCCGTVAPMDRDMLFRASLLPNVEVLNTLSKEDLAAYQRQARLWIYPGVFPETFCITAVENANAGNVIISPLSYGLSTTLDEITYLHDWNLPILDESTAPVFVEKALTVLNDDDYSFALANACMHGCADYNWDRATNEILNMMINDSMTYIDLHNRTMKQYDTCDANKQ